MAPSTPRGPIRIALVDRNAIIRAGIRLLVEAWPGVAVVAESGDCAAAARSIARRRPDVAVVALEQFDDAGLDRIAEAASATTTRLLALTDSEEPETVLRAVRAGALGVVTRDEPAKTLVRAVTSLHEREAWFRRITFASILLALRRANPAIGVDPLAARLATLTRREREVADLVSKGLRNREVAVRLFISEVTVRHHLTRVFEKLGVTNRVELLAFASHADTGT
jgi:two-component system nitrate/nitrite response regulator NarL